VESEQVVALETKQHFCRRICLNASSRSIGDEYSVSRPLEKHSVVIVNCGDDLGAQLTAPGPRMLLANHGWLFIAATLSMRR